MAARVEEAWQPKPPVLSCPLSCSTAFWHAADLLFRIARAELEAAQPDQALAAADRGLALGRDNTLFCANLLIARGEALEKLGRDTEAASSYYEALEINRKLLDHVLGAGDAGPP